MGVRVGRGTSPERGGPHRSARRRAAGHGPKARLEAIGKVLTNSNRRAMLCPTDE